ncbi:glycosyltransferase family 2 protein [Methanococcus sp. CF]
MPNNPLFSIITCTYNSEKYVSECIDSILSQTFTDYEHIFIDGSSSDDTLKIINEYKKNNEKVHVYSLPKKGISNAMNEGIKKSKGKYIIHLHADDLFYNPEVLEKVSKLLNDYDWVYGKSQHIDYDLKPIGMYLSKFKFFQRSSSNKLGKELIKWVNFIPHQSVFIKKDVFEKHGYFDESLKSGMDPDLWMRIRNDTKWVFIDVIVSKRRHTEESQSYGKQFKKENEECFKVVKKRHLNRIEFMISYFIYKILNR